MITRDLSLITKVGTTRCSMRLMAKPWSPCAGVGESAFLFCCVRMGSQINTNRLTPLQAGTAGGTEHVRGCSQDARSPAEAAAAGACTAPNKPVTVDRTARRQDRIVGGGI